jgi:hypothetical protein
LLCLKTRLDVCLSVWKTKPLLLLNGLEFWAFAYFFKFIRGLQVLEEMVPANNSSWEKD